MDQPTNLSRLANLIDATPKVVTHIQKVQMSQKGLRNHPSQSELKSAKRKWVKTQLTNQGQVWNHKRKHMVTVGDHIEKQTPVSFPVTTLKTEVQTEPQLTR